MNEIMEKTYDLIDELDASDIIKNITFYKTKIMDNDDIRELINKGNNTSDDYVIMDIKLADTERHKKFTGVGNEAILSNFEFLKKSAKPYLIRTPLIPNITDTKENLAAIKKLIGTSTWEQLPYNKMAGAKYKMLGMSYELNPAK